MKNIILVILISFCFSCRDLSEQVVAYNTQQEVEKRSTIDNLYVYDGLGTVVYSAVLNEYQISISEDFEFRPHGDLTWTAYGGGKVVRVQCSCPGGAQTGTCNPYSILSDPVQYGCANPCEGGCNMFLRITSGSTTLFSLNAGGEIRLQ